MVFKSDTKKEFMSLHNSKFLVEFSINVVTVFLEPFLINEYKISTNKTIQYKKFSRQNRVIS